MFCCAEWSIIVHWTAGYRRGLPRELSVALAGSVDDVIEFVERHSIPEPNTGCWLWQKTVNAKGYAYVCDPRQPINRASPKRVVVSRLLCEVLHGGIANWREEQARHTCDNPACVNPEHILPGTPMDNRIDMLQRGRAPDFRGTKNPNYRHGRCVQCFAPPDGV